MKAKVSDPSRLKLQESSLGKNPGSVFAPLNRTLRLPAVARARFSKTDNGMGNIWKTGR